MSGADSIILGNVSFSPAQTLPPEVANEVMDQMAESIVDLAHKLEESEARVAVLEEEQKILKRTIDSLRDEVCREWCHDKAAADGGWGNI
jgi:chaperonin cofactor prefoldin